MTASRVVGLIGAAFGALISGGQLYEGNTLAGAKVTTAMYVQAAGYVGLLGAAAGLLAALLVSRSRTTALVLNLVAAGCYLLAFEGQILGIALAVCFALAAYLAWSGGRHAVQKA